MPIITASTNDNTNLFLLDGLDQNRGAFILYYDSVEKNSSGVIDSTKIRVGLRSKYKENEILVSPQLLENWSGAGEAFGNVFSTGTITCASAVPNTFSTGTVTCVSSIASDTVTINGLVYTAVSGSKAGDFTKFSIDTSDAATGIDLEDSINNDVRVGTLGDVSAADNGAGVVTITTDVEGVAGDAVTLASNNGVTLAVSGAVFSGGVDADTVTVNGLVYTAVAGAKADDTQFTTAGGDNAVATDLADSIDDDLRAGTIGDLSSVAVGAVVTSTSSLSGTQGDAVTLVSSSATRLLTSGATFSGGVDFTLSAAITAISPLIA